jgi:peroxiredoxin
MKKLLLGSISALLALPVLAAIEAGSMAPMFEARASFDGKEFDFSLHNALEDGPVVVYFYPSAFTQGCNMQAHEFSENIAAFKEAGASIIGVSLDSIERLNDFSKDPDYCAGNLPVASDTDGSIARSYGINVMQGRAGATDTRGVEIGHDFAERITFIVTPDGKVANVIGGRQVSPIDNVHQSLEAVQKLAKYH